MITVERKPDGAWRFTVEHPSDDRTTQILPKTGDEMKALRIAMKIYEEWHRDG